jgi:hypothetical protein
MSDESNKLPVKQSLDGFDTFDDAVEGEKQRSRSVIQGILIKFTNEAKWVTRDGEELAPDLELAVVNVGRAVQKWVDQQSVETRILAPGEKYPDIKKLNEECLPDEWSEGPDGKPRGPWQAQHIVYLLNPLTLDRYTFPTGTMGGHRAVVDLVDKVKWKRRMCGGNVYPVVTLSDTFFPTRYGGRQRPHFIIQSWVGLGEDGTTQALPAPAPNSTLPPPANVKEQSAEKNQEDLFNPDGSVAGIIHRHTPQTKSATATKPAPKHVGSRA